MYDPLHEAYPEPHQPPPDSYWQATLSNALPLTMPPLTRDERAEVAIIGGGYTGLSAACHLAARGVDCVLLEANHSGWGCSGRNGGFVLAGTGRLSIPQMQKKWGHETAAQLYREFQYSIETVEELIYEGNIDCDKVAGGYLKLAHDENAANKLKQHASALAEQFAESVGFVDRQTVAADFIRTNLEYGGLYYPNCFALNPLKLARGYQSLAALRQVRLFAQSPVTDWHQSPGGHTLVTPQGNVTADKVIIASNGYTGKRMHPLVNKRHFPVMSSIIVTRPLTGDERRLVNMKSGLMAMDTRALKYYYRLLPDNRLLFGGRGAIQGKDAQRSIYRKRLEEGLRTTFFHLPAIETDYFWSGWVSVSLDDYPRLWHSEDDSVHYAMGYCGSGVAFAAQAGKRLAQMVCKEPIPELPYWQSPLKRFPFANMRRAGLAAFYLAANWFNA